MTAGYVNPDRVARAVRAAQAAVAVDQAVAADHARTILDALAHCEQTIDEYAGVLHELVDHGLITEGLTPDEFKAKYMGGAR